MGAHNISKLNSMSSTEIEEIKQRLDIVDVVSEYVQLKPGGINWKGLCPFHNEKTPSFMVNRERQFWRCFGCNEGGDVFAFFQKIEQMDFVEALKALAARAGVELKSYRPQEESLRSKLLDMHENACALFQKLLYSAQGAAALRYLKEQRKLTDETIRSWRLGYAPNDWRVLLMYLKGKGYQEQDMIASGLVLSSHGRSYDRFRNRVTFPVVSIHGQVVGFSARTLNAGSNEPASSERPASHKLREAGERDEPKYINSPQTQIYDKGAVVYGLFQARQSIRSQGYSILVEGNMDVVASTQAGVTNVVAASGTGLTNGHLQALGRFTKELHFCFDADAAGLRAAERGIALALSQQFFVKVIAIPKELGKDPGDLVERNPELWRELSRSAVPIMEYVLKRVEQEHDLRDVSVKKRVFSWAMDWLARVVEPVEREHYLHNIAQVFSIDESVVRSEVARRALAQGGGVGRNQVVGVGVPVPSSAIEVVPTKRLFETILSLALQSDEWFGYLVESLELEHVPDEYMALYKVLVRQYTIHNRTLSGEYLIPILQAESPEVELVYLSVFELGKEEVSQFTQPQLAYNELRTRLHRYQHRLLSHRRDELTRRITEAERTGDRTAFDAMLKEFQTISKQLSSD